MKRRILSLWFPRLAAERVLRAEPGLADRPLAVVADRRGALVLASLSPAAEVLGLRRGMALGDARAICPALVTRPDEPHRTEAFRAALRRWAGRFTPWVAEEDGPGGEGLLLDVTGCTRLFGGEAALAARVEAEAADLGLSLCLGLADTPGAAWAVARYAGAGAAASHSGDAIDQEARATRSRAQKRRWERGGAPPAPPGPEAPACRIVPPGETVAALGPLPVAALRLAPEEVAALQAFGLRRIADVAALPRADLARRVGPAVGRRLDQAFGRVPEPVSPSRPPQVYALRLTLPEPVGREEDVLAGIDRLLPPLCSRLATAGRGARRVRLVLIRTDGRSVVREVGLARPADRPEAIRPLLALGLGEIDAGFGIEVIRLEATETESVAARQHRGQLAVSAETGQKGRRGPAPRKAMASPTSSAGSVPASGSRPSSAFIPPKATCPRRPRPRWRLPSPPPPAPGRPPRRHGRSCSSSPSRSPRMASGRPRPSSGAGGRGGAPPPSDPSGSPRNGGSTTRPGAPGRATTGGSRRRRAPGCGFSRPRAPRFRAAGSPTACSRDPCAALLPRDPFGDRTPRGSLLLRKLAGRGFADGRPGPLPVDTHDAAAPAARAHRCPGRDAAAPPPPAAGKRPAGFGTPGAS